MVKVKTGRASLFKQEAVHRVLQLFDVEVDEVLLKMGQPRSFLRKVLYDDEVFAQFTLRWESLDALPWHIECADEDKKIFAEKNIKKIYENLKTAVNHAKPFGYSVCELIYKRPKSRGDAIFFKTASMKPLDWFRVTPDGELRFLPEDGSGGVEGLETDEFRYVLTRNSATYENPKGESILSRCYAPWFFKKTAREFWMIFLDKYAVPTAIGKTGGGVTDDGFDRITDLTEGLVALSQDGVLVIGDDQEVNFLEQRTNGEVFELCIKSLSRQIQKLILGQVDNSDSNSGGSYASEKISQQVRDRKIISDAKLREWAFNKALDNLFLINNVAGQQFSDETVKFVIDTNKFNVDRAERDKILKDAGAVFTEQYFIDEYGFKDSDFSKVTANAELSAKMSTSLINKQKEIDTLKVGTEQPLDSKLILSTIKKSKNQKELEDNFLKLLKSEKAKNKNFKTNLERAMFQVDTLGYLHSEETAHDVEGAIK